MSVECNYCGKEFTEENSEYDPETDKGIHVSKEHTNDEKITKSKADRDPYTSIVDEYKRQDKTDEVGQA